MPALCYATLRYAFFFLEKSDINNPPKSSYPCSSVVKSLHISAELSLSVFALLSLPGTAEEICPSPPPSPPPPPPTLPITPFPFKSRLVDSLISRGTRVRPGPGSSFRASAFRQTGQVPLALLVPASSRRCCCEKRRVSWMHLWQNRWPGRRRSRNGGLLVYCG